MALGPPEENETAQNARHQMNLLMSDVISSIDLIGIPRTVFYSPPPAIGGYAGPVDLIGGVFQFYQFRIEPQMAKDVLSRAVGVYETKATHLFRQCFNPFFWLGWAANKVLSVPFRILGQAGFDGNMLEHSLLGKLFKAIAGFAGFLLAVVGIADKLGYLEGLKALLHRLFR